VTKTAAASEYQSVKDFVVPTATILAALAAASLAGYFALLKRNVARRAQADGTRERMMRLDQLSLFAERLRKEAIGEPQWIEEKGVFEYSDHSAKVVAVLKMIRAAQGVHALDLLCRSGLFIDFGVIMRCVHDCEAEIYFLLEEFPKTSNTVDQFVNSFFESTIDGYLSMETHPVPTQKIRNAMVRVLKGRHDEETSARINNVFKTFSGYVHANYSHIMETYNGGARDFNLAGVASVQQRQMRMQHVELVAESVLHAAAFVAHTVGLNKLGNEIVPS
jgi:hypothetical protein